VAWIPAIRAAYAPREAAPGRSVVPPDEPDGAELPAWMEFSTFIVAASFADETACSVLVAWKSVPPAVLKGSFVCPFPEFPRVRARCCWPT
jgi:hypothetical protein